MIYERSFASNPRSAQWHPTLNGQEVPRGVYKNNNNKFWFTCETCHHDFDASLCNINGNNRWCPYCSSKKLCEAPECQRCYEKSFASHHRSSWWHPTLNIQAPRNVFKTSIVKRWFKCSICDHDFDTRLNDVSCNGKWCSYCSNRRLCKNVDCQMCHFNSFASSHRSSMWHPQLNEDITPRDIFKNKPRKFWFTCDTCNNVFQMSPNNITNRNSWCANCKYKTENKMYTILKNTWPSIIYQYKQDWCMKKNHLPFDFCIPGKKVIIELDGRHHFTQVSNWTTPEECLENDVFKQKCANENGYSVVRIIQKDVWLDKYDWRTKLQETIDGIHAGDCVNVFLCKNGEYDSRRAALIDAC